MNKKVLICDDEVYILEAVQYVVHRAGFASVLAQNGEEALALARKESPDLIIIDVSMPKQDGYEVCKLLKSNSKTRNIYVIVLTGGYYNDDSKSMESGVDEFITKPFSPNKLQERLYEILGSK
jgi:two-component system alkaline phosphatase synthesis response regulator PhoP